MMTSHDTPSSGATDTRSAWNVPRPAVLPRATYWPAVLAFGITALAFGIVTTVAISGVGLLVCAIAIGGWVVELGRER